MAKVRRLVGVFDETGAYIVFMVFFVVAAVTLCGVVIASGILAVNRTRFSNAVNNAALTVLEDFVRNTESELYDVRAKHARDRANNVILNSPMVPLFGMEGSPDLGILGFEGSPGTGGVIIFGNWMVEGTGPCREDHPAYPCFVPVDPPSEIPISQIRINAVKIQAKTRSPFKLPFGFFIGRDEFKVGFESIAALVPRRIVLLVDAGHSSFWETHKGWIESAMKAPLGPSQPQNLPCRPNDNLFKYPTYYICPRDAALFAFGYGDGSDGVGVITPTDGNFSRCHTDPTVYNQPQGKIWCNMAWINQDGYQVYRCRGASGAAGPCEPWNNQPSVPAFQNAEVSLGTGETDHYPNDYMAFYNVPLGPSGGAPLKNLWIDVHTKPKPFSSFMAAFNSVAHMLQDQRSVSDKAKIMGFKKAIFHEYPASGWGFSSDLEFIEQITNVNNIKPNAGPSGPIEPNYVRLGYVPSPDPNDQYAGSAFVRALEAALADLANTEFSPTSARKIIIAATDGMMNCSKESGDWVCGNRWEYFRYSENYLFSDDALPGRPSCENNQPCSLLQRLQKAKVAVSIIHSGSHVGPHYLNKQTESGKWLDYEIAQALGYGALPRDFPGSAPDRWFVDPTSVGCGSMGQPPCDCTPEGGSNPCEGGVDEFAFYHAGEDWDHDGKVDVVFYRAAGDLAHLALKTGGIYIPQNELFIHPDYPDDPDYCYKAEYPRVMTDECHQYIKDHLLAAEDRLVWAPEYIDGVSKDDQKAAFAAVKAQEAAGLKPFFLVREY